jgi:hypothetical protein
MIALAAISFGSVYAHSTAPTVKALQQDTSKKKKMKKDTSKKKKDSTKVQKMFK